MKFSIKDLFRISSKPHFNEDLVTITEEISNGKLHFLCNVNYFKILLDFFWVYYSDKYNLKQTLGGVPRKNVLLKFEHKKGDE